MRTVVPRMEKSRGTDRHPSPHSEHFHPNQLSSCEGQTLTLPVTVTPGGRGGGNARSGRRHLVLELALRLRSQRQSRAFSLGFTVHMAVTPTTFGSCQLCDPEPFKTQKRTAMPEFDTSEFSKR